MTKRKAVRSPASRKTPQQPAAEGVTAPGPTLLRVAVSWMVLAALEIGLNAVVPGTGLGDADSPLGARIGFLASGLVALAVGVGAVGLLLAPPVLFGRRLPGPGRWIIRATRGVILWAAVLLYGASWAAFWNTGAFLDREALAFWAPHPIQVFHWVYPPLALGLIAWTIALTALLALTPRWVARWPTAAQRRLAWTAGGALGGCVALAVTGGLVYGWDALVRSPSPYAVTRSTHAGPLVHLFLDLQRRHAGASQPPRTGGGETLRVVPRPLVSMDQYLAGVEPGRLRRLNVLMVQIESLRADQLRVYGGTRDVMPTLDALARDSRVFTGAYVQASHSNYADPVPLSSHYPLRSREMYTFPENPTYPRVLIYDVLKALGYRTAIFSSQNERWGGMINFHRPENLDRFFHAETFAGPTYTPWEDIGFAEWVKQTGSAGSVDDRYTVGEAIQWIDSLEGEPFFLHMNLQSSHVPYVVPPDFPTRFGPRTLDFTIMWGKFPTHRVEAVKDRYADSLFYVDTQIARLFEHVRRKGLWDDTVIVIGGDNGEAFYEHGFAAHASWLFDEVVKVPMIVRVPGLQAGVDDRPAMFLDVPPSILALLGLPPHPSFQGISLFDPRSNPDRSIFIVAQTPSAYETAIVRSGFKLHWAEREDRYFLNDLVADPGEITDVGPSRPDLVEDLARRLHQWREEQLAYYADVARQQREYPPLFED